MENYSIPSVANNHRKSFNSTIEQTRNYLNRLESDYESKYQLIDKLSSDKKKAISLLEDKYKKYNLTYDVPLIKCDINKIEKYSEELSSQLSVSFVAVDPTKQMDMNDDLVEITSLTAKINQLVKNIEIVGSMLDKLEKELSSIRVPEADSKQELSVNFKDILKKKKESKIEEKKEPVSYEEARLDSMLEKAFNEDKKETMPEVPYEVKEFRTQPGLVILDTADTSDLEEDPDERGILDTIQISLDEIKKKESENTEEVEEIPSTLFNTDEEVSEEEEINPGFLRKFFSKLENGSQPESVEPKKVIKSVTPEDKDLGYASVILASGLSLSNYSEAVYRNPEYWIYVYNYNDKNKGAIDRRAAELGITVDEIVNNPDALVGLEIDFPEEIVINKSVAGESEGFVRR